MGVLRVDHPDIFDFVCCKSDQTVLNGFNISVGLTDKFMNAYVEESEGRGDGSFDLVNPRTNCVTRTVKASEVMAAIVKNAHHNGEPGVLFLDEINRKNPMPHMYKIETTNPCGEQALGPYEVQRMVESISSNSPGPELLPRLDQPRQTHRLAQRRSIRQHRLGKAAEDRRQGRPLPRRRGDGKPLRAQHRRAEDRGARRAPHRARVHGAGRRADGDRMPLRRAGRSRDDRAHHALHALRGDARVDRARQGARAVPQDCRQHLRPERHQVEAARPAVHHGRRRPHRLEGRDGRHPQIRHPQRGADDAGADRNDRHRRGSRRLRHRGFPPTRDPALTPKSHRNRALRCPTRAR